MLFPKNVGRSVIDHIKPIWDDNNRPDSDRALEMYIVLARLQGLLLSDVIKMCVGNNVYGGPFKGMVMTPEVLIGHYSPSLLGCYEHELHDIIERIIARPYKQIINIGCAYGYYTVGLARRMPEAKIYSYDIDDVVLKKCADMVKANDVGNRVTLGAEFRGEDYEKFAGPETLVLMDIEGAEMGLLDPVAYPALKNMDVLVELHDCDNPAISKTIVSRFIHTHEVEFVRNQPKQYPLDEIFGSGYNIHHLDYMVASWEGRSGPTPWGFMTRKGKYPK